MSLAIEDISQFPQHIQDQIRKKCSGVEKPKNNKFRNKPGEARGIRFQSQKEIHRFNYLILRQQAGEIRDLRL